MASGIALAALLTLQSTTVPPHGFRMGGYDLYELIEAKCGTKPPRTTF